MSTQSPARPDPVSDRSAGDDHPGPLTRVWRRLSWSQEDLEAAELQEGVRTEKCTPIATAPDRQLVRLSGTVRHVILQPRSGTPALEAELYDGSGTVTLVWLGRRRIVGIEPGVTLTVHGRISDQGRGAPVMYNPRYELHP